MESLYRVRICGANKLWKKYIIFSGQLRLQSSGERINSVEYVSNNSTEPLMVKALLSGGDYADKETQFDKKILPEFADVEHQILIRDDVFSHLCTQINGIYAIDVSICGEFSHGYKLLSFDRVVNCIDDEQSFRAESFGDIFGKLVLEKSTVPKDVDGFFLKGWNGFGYYVVVVNEQLKEALCSLPKAKEFLIFEEFSQTDNSYVWCGERFEPREK